MQEVLSEYFSDDKKKKSSSADDYYKFQQVNTFEVLWQGKSVGVYQTEQEAENIAENYALGSQVSRT